jgi:DNA-binding MarR family transcriptional regulator
MASTENSSRSVARGNDSDKPQSIVEMIDHRLARLSSAIEQLAENEARRAAELSLPEYRVLTVLQDKGPLGVAGLQSLMQIDKAWISRTLSRLADKGLVDSSADDTDARRTSYRLTAQGRRTATSLMKRAVKREEQILAGVEGKDRARLFSLLDRVQQNIDDLKG